MGINNPFTKAQGDTSRKIPAGSLIRKSNSLKNIEHPRSGKKNKIKFKDGNQSDSNSQDSKDQKKNSFTSKIAERQRIEKLNAMYIKNLEAQAQKKLLYKSLDLSKTVKNPVDGQLYAPSRNGGEITER